jgi:hypothetical protein
LQRVVKEQARLGYFHRVRSGFLCRTRSASSIPSLDLPGDRADAPALRGPGDKHQRVTGLTRGPKR